MDARTYKRPRSNMPLQLLRSWGHNDYQHHMFSSRNKKIYSCYPLLPESISPHTIQHDFLHNHVLRNVNWTSLPTPMTSPDPTQQSHDKMLNGYLFYSLYMLHDYHQKKLILTLVPPIQNHSPTPTTPRVTIVLLCWGLTTRQPLQGHFVLSPREREKTDRRDSRRDEREGLGRKRYRNESEETEEIKTFPLYPYLLQE